MSSLTDLNDKLNIKQFTEPKLYQSAGAADATLGATFTATNLGGWAVLDTLSKA